MKTIGLVFVLLGFAVAATILFLLYTNPAGGWEWQRFSSWVFGLILTLFLMAPYALLFYTVRHVRVSMARLVGLLVIIGVGIYIEAFAYLEYGHGTPMFLLIAALFQYLFTFLAQKIWIWRDRP